MRKRSTEGDGFSHSMTDLMAGVAVTFLLIAAIFMVQVARSAARTVAEKRTAEEELKKITKTDARAIDELRSLRSALEDDAELRGVVELLYDADKDPYLLTIVLDRGRLRFDVGDCALRPDTQEIIGASFGRIFSRVCETADSGFVQSITLEGHTDNRPFFPSDRVCGVEPARRNCALLMDPECLALGFANNVRLSAARAQNVFFEMRRLLADRQTIARCLDTKFVVAGRGPVEPADGGDWKVTRSEIENDRNRRVVIEVRAVAGSSVVSAAP